MKWTESLEYIVISVQSGCISSKFKAKGKNVDAIVVPRDDSEVSGVLKD